MHYKYFISKLFHDYVTKEGRYKKWRYLDNSQWFSQEKLLEMQQEKLKDILLYAKNNVACFKTIDIASASLEVDSLELLKQFPVTDKSFYRNQGDNCRSDNASNYNYSTSSTSGSTGESFFFDIDQERLSWAFASKYRTDSYCDIMPYERRASLWGASFDNKSKGFKDRLRKFLTPFTFMSSYDLSEGKMQEYVATLKADKPGLLISYPSPLVQFAEHCKKHNVVFPFLKSIICSSEQLYDFQREIIEDVFKAKVYNRYGTREFGSIAQECSTNNGLHVNVERIFIEILDENDNPCPVGVKGQLVITDLDNKVMPLIRYKVGDFAAWASSDPCDCGRGLQKLEFVEGRSFDVVKTESGDVISGTFWTLLLRHISKDIKQFQVVQNTLGAIVINLVTHSTNPLDKAQVELLLLKIAEQATGLKTEIKYVDEIPLTKSGKNRFVISNLS